LRRPRPEAHFAPHRIEAIMFNWLRRRRLSAEARKKLLLLSARSEEAIVETHVANLLDLLTSLGDEIDLDRGIELYVEMMSLDETLATTVTNRLLARLENPGKRAIAQAKRFKNAFR
jgi:hypothetical protein